ncbi:N-acetylmuramidase domain-containing protein [Mesorhizobium australicum]|uniref:Putative peptidoglycan binding domain-containing protein n=1 Tax=Mesorhizobium australicum TaxID=536018 RepID=A0A1X7NXM0_9HYPH|nr:N-acetylmuramidase domain-containing protein [Mesorhizobium australicum]SMH42250.1 Putative peptidoglycan binding domain-containing protein [Mesorhizobium australicum]
MFDAETRAAAAAAAARNGWETAALLAVIEIESGGKVFAIVDGRQEPLIRFEGHYFDKRVPAAKRPAARAAGLADPKAGAVKNPASQAARWTMLNRAIEIDANAALESVSWGVGQVMGSHWDWLGYASVTAMVNTARSGAAGQIELMERYIDKAGLSKAVSRRDWPAFARGYNGPDYKRHGYDTKLASAYRRHAGQVSGVLRLGARGDAVKELQTLLAGAGHALTADGDFGPKTAAAVRAFQRAAGLTVDGIAGPATLSALRNQA